ncbi:hypothetical protein Ddc_01426 [Ditylenchus destructor]|nr:hypothetical protein Ddc_01426 [Ditylenchus destructor]
MSRLVLSIEIILLVCKLACSRVIFNENAYNGGTGISDDSYSCSYQDGMISENGVSRQATETEKAGMERYAQDLERYNSQMSNRMMSDMDRMFSQVFRGFPFSSHPNTMLSRPELSNENMMAMPQPPVFCQNTK